MNKAANHETSNNYSRFIDEDDDSGSFRVPLTTEISQSKEQKMSIDTQIKTLRKINSCDRIEYQEP